MIDLFTYFIYLSLLFLVVYLANIASLKQRTMTDILEINKTNKLSIYHFVALIFICFVVGFRFEVGVDWKDYKNIYEALSLDKSMTFQDTYGEWGYFIINKLLANLDFNYTMMFFTLALITWYFIFKSVPAILLPLILFFLFTDEFFFSSMNLVRQYVAMGIFLYSIKFIINRNLIKYLFCIALAMLFHTSALFLLFLYFLPYEKLYNQKLWLITFLISFFFRGNQFIVDSLQSLLYFLANHLLLLENYLDYFSRGDIELVETVVGFGYFFRIIITIFIVLFSKAVVKKYPKTAIYFILYFSGAIFFNIFYTTTIVLRIVNYLLIMRTITLALVICYLWQSGKYRILSIGVICLYLLFYLGMIFKPTNMYSPFKFVFMQ
jgi:transmembrane protein EpsG